MKGTFASFMFLLFFLGGGESKGDHKEHRNPFWRGRTLKKDHNQMSVLKGAICGPQNSVEIHVLLFFLSSYPLSGWFVGKPKRKSQSLGVHILSPYTSGQPQMDARGVPCCFFFLFYKTQWLPNLLSSDPPLKVFNL